MMTHLLIILENELSLKATIPSYNFWRYLGLPIRSRGPSSMMFCSHDWKRGIKSTRHIIGPLYVPLIVTDWTSSLHGTGTSKEIN